MSGRAAQLAIELAERGAADVAGALDRVGSSAASMGDKVESAGRQASKGAAGLDRTAEGADEVASKGAQAAGAMSGLGDLIGGKFGSAMAVGGVGLQAMADSGDLLNAALENSIVTTARARVGTIAKSVADKASAVATRGMTIAQKALNLAQRASPIGLIITGVILLGTVLVIAYKRSATFRAIVQGALGAVQAAVGRVVGVFRALPGIVSNAWQAVTGAVQSARQSIADKADAIRDKLVDAWNTIRDKGAAAFHALTAPIQAIVDLVQGLLDKIASIHLPHLPHLGNPFNRAGGSTTSSTSSTSSTVNITLNVQVTPGTTSSQAGTQAQAMMDAIDARLRLVGRAPVFAR